MAYRPGYSAREPRKKVFLRSAHGNRAYFLTHPMRRTDIHTSASRYSMIGAHIITRFLFTLFCILPLCVSTTFSAAATSHTAVNPASSPIQSVTRSKYQRGILWKIAVPGVKSSYLFGTVHSDDARVTALPDLVTRALDASDRFAMEAIMDGAGLILLARAMYFNDGRTLEQAVGKELYAESMKALTGHGIPTQGVEQQKPWAVMMALSMPRPKSGEFLDLVLEQRAKRQNKPVSGLESIEEQIAVFDELSLPDQTALLKEAVRTQHYFDEELEKLIQAYLARDLVTLEEISGKHELQDDRIFHVVTDRLLIKRNRRMAARMMPILKEGGAFIAVGVAHLPGATGLLNLIEKAGYRATPVY